MSVTVIVCPPSEDIQNVLGRCREEAPGLELQVEEICSGAELESRIRALAEVAAGIFTVNTNDGVRLVRAEDILLCRAERHRFRLWMKNGEQLVSRTTRWSFSRNVAPLLSMERFLRAGATVLVSVDAIEAIRDGHIYMTNGMKLSFPARWQTQAEQTLRCGKLG